MSRNLGRTDCYFCGGDVKLDEAPREVTREDVGGYYDTRDGYGYAGMIVANATCVDCCAKYLAWVSLAACAGYGSRYHDERCGERDFSDLSFRSSFNDEPGEEDLPDFKIERVPQRTPWPVCGACKKKRYYCRCVAEDVVDMIMSRPDFMKKVVGEVEKIVDVMGDVAGSLLAASVLELRADNVRLREALAFYADPETYEGHAVGYEWAAAIENDNGARARAALTGVT